MLANMLLQWISVCLLYTAIIYLHISIEYKQIFLEAPCFGATSWDTWGVRDARDASGTRDMRGAGDTRDARGARDAKHGRGARDARGRASKNRGSRV